MKRILFVLSIYILSLNLFAFDTNQNKLWISIEPIVLAKIKMAKYRVFNFDEVIQSPKETFYLVSEDQLPKISHFIHHSFTHCGGYHVLMVPPTFEKSHSMNKGASQLVFQDFWPNEYDSKIITDYSISRQAEVNNWFQQISNSHIDSIIVHLSSYFTRFYTTPEGVEALKWIGQTWENLAHIRSDIKVEYFKHKNHNQPSIILTIEGSDPIEKNKVIILGGHGDSINTWEKEPILAAPGANDNAASIGVLTDILKILIEQNYRPKHTIQFIAYAAEEVGLQGSMELAHIYRNRGQVVQGVIQFDGINYAGKTFEMGLISDLTHAEQNKFMGQLIDTYLSVKWTYDRCGYACSDHASWHMEGYRASFPVEAIMDEQDPYIHSAYDTFDKSGSNSNHAVLFEKLGIAYLLELDK